MDANNATADALESRDGDVTNRPKEVAGTQEERCMTDDACPPPEVYQNGCETMETSEKQEVTSAGKEPSRDIPREPSRDIPRDPSRDSPRDPSFAGVTVVTNPPEQVTVS